MMNAEQKAAWLSARCGKLTASRMLDAMDFLKNGAPSSKRQRLMFELLAERVTGENATHFVTDAMQHGIDFEDEAVDKFVELTGRDVQLSHFYDHPEIGNFGATPDREIEDGLLEVKCPTTPVFLEYKLAGIVPPQYRPQILAQLACTRKKWCGFIAYDPRIKDERKQLFLAKLEPAPGEIANIEDAARKFLGDLEKMFDQFVGA